MQNNRKNENSSYQVNKKKLRLIFEMAATAIAVVLGVALGTHSYLQQVIKDVDKEGDIKLLDSSLKLMKSGEQVIELNILAAEADALQKEDCEVPDKVMRSTAELHRDISRFRESLVSKNTLTQEQNNDFIRRENDALAAMNTKARHLKDICQSKFSANSNIPDHNASAHASDLPNLDLNIRLEPKLDMNK